MQRNRHPIDIDKEETTWAVYDIEREKGDQNEKLQMKNKKIS